jgi:dihydrofolate reductase
MIISHLVARSKNNVIGINNNLPWTLKDDLSHFKAYTLGKPMLMGRKTYESIGRPLPGRTSIVVTSKNIARQSDLLTCKSLDEGISMASQIFSEELIIIGGGEIFKATLPLANKLVITEVKCSLTGDVFYPEIDLSRWESRLISHQEKNISNEYEFNIMEYIKNN